MSTRVGFGQRRIRVTPEAIEGWLTSGGKVETDLPDDARFVRMYPDEKGRWYYIVLESETWDELPEAAEIPEMDVDVRMQPITFKISAEP